MAEFVQNKQLDSSKKIFFEFRHEFFQQYILFYKQYVSFVDKLSDFACMVFVLQYTFQMSFRYMQCGAKNYYMHCLLMVCQFSQDISHCWWITFLFLVSVFNCMITDCPRDISMWFSFRMSRSRSLEVYCSVHSLHMIHDNISYLGFHTTAFVLCRHSFSEFMFIINTGVISAKRFGFLRQIIKVQDSGCKLSRHQCI